jgi:predicted nucleic acid-binding protein
VTEPVDLDASAALAILRAEPSAQAVRRAIPVAERLIVPELFWLEVANALARRFGWEGEAIVEAVRELDELGLESVPIPRAVLLAAIDIVDRHALTAYDALYLALAESENARLLTLDARLAAAAGARAITVEGIDHRRFAEAPAGYGGDPINWTRFGPYLARLRAEYAGRLERQPGADRRT